MRAYWLKIVLGALGVFVVGMVVVAMGRSLRAKASVMAHTDSPITIPIPFVPFQVDGERVGTFERIVIRRKSPHDVSGVDLAVKLDDPRAAARLAGCHLLAKLNAAGAHGDAFTIHDAAFSCLHGDADSVEQIGVVHLASGDSVPLVVDTAVAAQIRKEGAGNRAEAAADSIAEAASALADSISDAADRAADSVEQSHQQAADSLRRTMLRRADSVRERARALRDSIRRATRAS
jgi:hypothetical protein